MTTYPESDVLRSTINDSAGKLCAASFGVRPPVVLPPTGSIHVFLDELENKSSISRGYDGTAIRVWKKNGRVETSTHKRIRPVDSCWGGSPYFTEMYLMLGGKTDSLFEDGPDSNMCFHYLMVHPCVQIASQDPDVGSGYLVALGVTHLDNPVALQRPTPAMGFPLLELSAGAAHDFLRDGFGTPKNLRATNGDIIYLGDDDDRLSPGEFVVVTEWSGEPWASDVVAMHQIHSFGYNFRLGIRNNESTYWHNIFMLSRGAVQYQDLNDYTGHYPWISSLMPQDQTGAFHGGGTRNSTETDITRTSITCRMHNLWHVLIHATPPTGKEIVSHMVHEFHMFKPFLAKWIHNHMCKRTGTVEKNERLLEITALAKAKQVKYPDTSLLDQLHFIIRTERSHSLYRLWEFFVSQTYY